VALQSIPAQGHDAADPGGAQAFNLHIITVSDFPIPVIDPTSKADVAAHDQIVGLVEQMLDLHQRRAVAKTPHEQTALDRQISATDARIDRLAYDLYGLTEEEIRLVEGQ
jgi:hypothetical protein